MRESLFYAIITVIIIVGGISVGVAYDQMVNGGSSSHNVGEYHLDIVEVMDANFGGNMGAQPRYYIVSGNTLESAANITLPLETRITVTITAYDMGNASVDNQFLKVIGVVGDSVEIIDGEVAMGDNISQEWETNVSSFPAAKVLHTFTILQGTTTLVNIPVMPGYTEIASFYLNNSGSYVWQCEAACGTGSSGWSGAMSTPGWMQGAVYVQ